jgi:hypothetical protein
VNIKSSRGHLHGFAITFSTMARVEYRLEAILRALASDGLWRSLILSTTCGFQRVDDHVGKTVFAANFSNLVQ